MKRFLFIIIIFQTVFAINGYAQYYSVNYDTKTVAAMAAAFGSEVAAESYYGEQVANVLKHYNAAEVATAGIFASKFLERKALTNIDIWNNPTENYYYRRIYHMVSEKILPKIWIVAGQMLHSPHNAIYWGSYLMKVCAEVKSLCMQFESVVTNGSLSFSDIAFLEFKDELSSIFKLSEIGGIDWELMLDDIAKVPGNFSKENLKADLDNLYRMGAGLASSGITNIGNALLQQNSFHDIMGGKVSSVIDIYENYESLFQQIDSDVSGTLIGFLGGKQDVAELFQPSNYNISSWMTDYLDETKGQYYTQRWYIARREQGETILCDYQPPTDDNSILKGDHWVRFETKNTSFYPNAQQKEMVLSNSERHAGWSRNKVNQLNQSNDGFHYSIEYSMSGYTISRKGKQTKKAYAFSILVKKSWDNTEVVYEDIFDSYTMDLNAFKAQMNVKLSEFNDNEEGYVYYLMSDNRNYYQATDALKLKGCETVTISVTCSDGASLGHGTTQYKCRKCGKSLNAHSKECAMMTTVTDNDIDTSELDRLKAEADNQIVLLTSQIAQLETENKQLLRLISESSVEDAAIYRQQYNNNLNSISSLKSELAEWERKQKEYEDAIYEAGQDNAVQTDDYYRIPALMQDCRTAYNLTWKDKGHWYGYSYVRTASMPNINGEITFKASLKIARKPKYFLGIKIHRAITQIDWELTSDYIQTHIAEVMTLDPSMPDEAKAKLVNQHISEIARQYPDCKITTEYAKSEPVEEDKTPNVIHLLWASDRLQIAREVDTRLTKIYADLVSLEKMMHYKRSILDVLNELLPPFDYDQGRRLTIVQECHKRWIDNAKKKK